MFLVVLARLLPILVAIAAAIELHRKRFSDHKPYWFVIFCMACLIALLA